MSIDQILEFLNSWTSIFGNFIEYTTMPLEDFVPDWFSVVLPDQIANFTLFSVIFGAGFIVYIGVTIAKFILGSIPFA